MSGIKRVVQSTYTEILERQGLDPQSGPDEYFFVRACQGTFANQLEGDWYAVPREINVTNPLNGDQDTGELYENGAFVSHRAELIDGLYGNKLGAAAMILGTSHIRNASIGRRTILSNAEVTHSQLDSHVTIGDKAKVEGDQFGKTNIAERVYIGANARVLGDSTVGRMATIGDGVFIISSIVERHSTIDATDESDSRIPLSGLRTHRTFIGRSVIGVNSTVETNARVESTTVGDGVFIGSGAYLENIEIKNFTFVPTDASLRVPYSDARTQEAVDTPIVQRRHRMWRRK